jgi:hypothetical protein
MALPTMRGILGDEKAFAYYFEGSLKESREQHPFLGMSYPDRVGRKLRRQVRGGDHRKVRKEDIGERPTNRQSGRVSYISKDPKFELRDTKRQPPMN